MAASHPTAGLRATCVAIVLSLSLVAVLPATALAAFPGPNGKIAFSNLQLYVMEPDGSETRQITDHWVGQPAFAPDGRRIAYVSTESDDRGIFVVNVNGAGLKRLTSSVGDTDPSFSGDGERIVFSRSDSAGNNIYVMSADGSDVTALTATGRDFFPAFSPDGKKIVFTSTRDGVSADIYVMDADGTNVTKLTDTAAATETQPAFSPNGSSIAYLREDRQESGALGTPNIWKMKSDGTAQTQLTDTTDFDGAPAWSPDGTRIVFSRLHRGPTGTEELYVMNADGSGQSSFTPEGVPDAQNPDWGPRADADPPETTVTAGPVGTYEDSDELQLPDLEFSSSETESAFECKGDYYDYQDNGFRGLDTDWEACISPVAAFDYEVRDYMFEVRAIDPAGNVDPTPAVRTWKIVPPGNPDPFAWGEDPLREVYVKRGKCDVLVGKAFYMLKDYHTKVVLKTQIKEDRTWLTKRKKVEKFKGGEGSQELHSSPQVKKRVPLKQLRKQKLRTLAKVVVKQQGSPKKWVLKERERLKRKHCR